MSGLSSAYPPPPPWFRDFTDENITKAKECGSEVPEGLANLVPPSPPTSNSDTYRGFGNLWNVQDQLVPLEKVGVTQLYSADAETKTSVLVYELRKLLSSVLVKFLALVTTLANSPEQFHPLVEDLRVLFINMHHLLNIYRPLQSQESLMMQMEAEIQRKRERTAELRTSNAAILVRIDALSSRLPRLHAAGSVVTTQQPDDWPPELL